MGLWILLLVLYFLAVVYLVTPKSGVPGQYSHVAPYDINAQWYRQQYLKRIVDDYQFRIAAGEILHEYEREHMTFRLSELTSLTEHNTLEQFSPD